MNQTLANGDQAIMFIVVTKIGNTCESEANWGCVSVSLGAQTRNFRLFLKFPYFVPFGVCEQSLCLMGVCNSCRYEFCGSRKYERSEKTAQTATKR